MNRAIIAAAISLSAFAFAGGASAQEEAAQPNESHVLRVSGLYDFGGGVDLQHGFGSDLRYKFYPTRDFDGYFGLFGAEEYQTGDAWRFAGGLTAGWGPVGLDVGVSHRTATADFAGSTGLNIGSSITFGPVSLGGRLTIPLVDHIPVNVAQMPGVQGIEGAFTISLGWDFTLAGARRNCCCPGHGHGHGHGGGHGQ